jgi:hypothetical protein
MRIARAQSGLSLLELVAATGLLLTVLGGVFGALSSATRTAGSSLPLALLDREVHRTLHRIAEQASMAGVGTLVTAPTGPLGGDDLSFRVNHGWSAGAVVWGPEISIRWEPDPADPLDGIDNDRDGIADEGQVVWIRNPGAIDEERQLWLADVPRLLAGENQNNLDDNGNGVIDERGLSFALDGNVLTIRLSAARADADRRVAVRTVETSVRMRN